MRRVSSRQRLVSWDAFDAAASDSEEEQDFITCYDASLSRNSSFAAFEDGLLVLDSGIQPLHVSRRKREREPTTSSSMKKSVSISDLLPVVITAHAHEVVPDSLVESLVYRPSTLLPLDTLVNDVQLCIFSFLSPGEARTMALVSKHYRRLLHSKECMTQWQEWFQRRWPNHAAERFEFVDGLNLSTALVEKNKDQPINMSVLMGMAARHSPTSIDKSQFTPRPVALQRPRHPDSTPRRTMFRTLHTENGSLATQYLGPIGTGDRCIRADQPLARPERLGMSFANKV